MSAMATRRAHLHPSTSGLNDLIRLIAIRSSLNAELICPRSGLAHYDHPIGHISASASIVFVNGTTDVSDSL